jgi:hypothetical protein
MMPAATRGTPRRHPQDLTGREDDRLRLENAAAIEQAGEEMALAAPVRRRRSKRVTDYTDAARPKVAVAPAPAAPAEPREYVVRLVASIEDMTFGKEIIDRGEFDAGLNGYTRPPVIGGLKSYSFIEGQLYKVDEGLYQHLKELGYLYEDDDEED